MRLVFLGTGDIGLPSLEALIQSTEHELLAVVTQPDKPVGRKQVLTPPAVKVRALEANLPVFQPERLRRDETTLAALKELQADAFIVVAYGQILPREVLDMPKQACLNIHASLLPRHRGASPIQAAIRDGDAESGITIMWMDEGLDTGDILLQHRLPITSETTGGSLHDQLAEMAPAALSEALKLLAEGKAPKIPQEPALATHCRKLERSDGRIDWTQSAVEIDRLIRAYNPWPGTFCHVTIKDGSQAILKIHRCRVVENAEACANGGTVLSVDDGWRISCGDGVLELVEVQLEGRKRVSADDFVRGYGIQPGAQLA